MGLHKINLLLVTFDQWRGDWTDPVKPIVKLPCLEELAQKGLTARRCYTSSPQCVPARMSWLTGLYPSQMGITRNCDAEIPADAPSIFRELQKAGWETELIGKTHWTSHLRPGDLRKKQKVIEDLGFNRVNEVAGPRALQIMTCELTDDWKKEGVFEKYKEDMKRRYRHGRNNAAWSIRSTVLPNHLYPDIWIANKGIEAIQNMPTNKPWLLWISFIGPHEPFDTPKQWEEYKKNSLPRFIEQANWIKRLRDGTELKENAESWKDYLNKESIDACRTDYANNLQLLDNQLRRLIDALENTQSANRTAILVTADHGEMLGDHQMLYKSTFLEASIRVPFLYIPPKISGRKRTLIGKPVELTSTFNLAITNIMKGGRIKNIQEHCKKQKHVTVEFGKELLIIKNKQKICCNREGEALWMTNLKKDPREQTNEHNKEKETLYINRKERSIYSIAREEAKLRKNKKWLWRNCTKN